MSSGGIDVLTFWAVSLAILSNVACALVGCYLVLRKMSLLGDAISHGVLPGLAIAFFLTGQLTGWPILLGAIALGVLTAFLTRAIQSTGKVGEDSSMGIVFTALFAVGVLLVSRAGSSTHLDVDCVLEGDLLNAALTVTTVFGVGVPKGVLLLGPTLLIVLLLVLVLWKELKIVSFDPALATAMGLNATVVHYLLMALVGVVTVAAFNVVGTVLVIAMLVIPAACGQLLTDRLGVMMLWAAGVAVVSSVLGYQSSVWLNTSPGPMMAVVAGFQLVLCVFLAPRHGLLSKLLRNARLSLRIACEDVLTRLYRAEEKGEPRGLTAEELRGLRGGFLGGLVLPSLRRRGHVLPVDGGRVTLTDAGRARAASLLRAHRLWESYLGEVAQLPADHLHDPAERMEHVLGPELQEELARELHRPDVDPHGKAIPPSPPTGGS